jgi:hypothetical protein
VKIAHFKDNKNRRAQVTLDDTNRRNTMTKQNIVLWFSLSYFLMLPLCRSIIRILLLALAGALFKKFMNFLENLFYCIIFCVPDIPFLGLHIQSVDHKING